MDDTPTETRDGFIAGLRELADWFEQTPDVPLPSFTIEVGLYVGLSEPEEFAKQVRLLGGNREKEYTDDIVRVTRDFGPLLKVKLVTARDVVCERKVVGTETVMVPDPDAPMVSRVRDKVVWECSPLLHVDEYLMEQDALHEERLQQEAGRG